MSGCVFCRFLCVCGSRVSVVHALFLTRSRQCRQPVDRSSRSLFYRRPVIRRRGTRRGRARFGVGGGSRSGAHSRHGTGGVVGFSLSGAHSRHGNQRTSRLLAAVQWSKFSDLTEVHAVQRLIGGRLDRACPVLRRPGTKRWQARPHRPRSIRRLTHRILNRAAQRGCARLGALQVLATIVLLRRRTSPYR